MTKNAVWGPLPIWKCVKILKQLWENAEFHFLVHFMAQKAEYRNPCQWHSVKVIIFTCYIGMLHSNIRVSGLNFKCIMIWYWKMVVDGTVHSWCMSPIYKRSITVRLTCTYSWISLSSDVYWWLRCNFEISPIRRSRSE